MKKFLKDEKGDSNFVSLIIVLLLMIAAILLFKPYIAQFTTWILSIS